MITLPPLTRNHRLQCVLFLVLVPALAFGSPGFKHTARTKLLVDMFDFDGRSLLNDRVQLSDVTRDDTVGLFGSIDFGDEFGIFSSNNTQDYLTSAISELGVGDHDRTELCHPKCTWMSPSSLHVNEKEVKGTKRSKNTCVQIHHVKTTDVSRVLKDARVIVFTLRVENHGGGLPVDHSGNTMDGLEKERTFVLRDLENGFEDIVQLNVNVEVVAQLFNCFDGCSTRMGVRSITATAGRGSQPIDLGSKFTHVLQYGAERVGRQDGSDWQQFLKRVFYYFLAAIGGVLVFFGVILGSVMLASRKLPGVRHDVVVHPDESDYEDDDTVPFVRHEDSDNTAPRV